MKRIYIRAGISPLDSVPIETAIERNMIKSNSGNLIYQYSVFRALMGEDTTFDARDFVDVCSQPGGVERVNETCDCAVLTLANAFRKDYPIGKLADMVKQLKIPCVVVGCGVQAANLAEIRDGLPFDGETRRFISAVLDKSAIVGLRGELTAEYLKGLGFVPERHFTVIGCPSFFLHGPNLPEPRLAPIDSNTRVSINTRPTQRPEMHALLARAERQFPNYHLVFQRIKELRMIAVGIPHRVPGPDRDHTGYYPFNQLHPDVRSGRVIGFTEARTWMDYMKDIDYSFGSRIHGNIAAVLSGVPAFVFTSDTRTEELCRFGNIPYMPFEALKGDVDIRAILEGADFRGVLRGHRQRFEHYVDFLNRNGLEHIWRGGDAPQDAPFDIAMRRVPMGGYVRYGCIGRGEAFRFRMRYYANRLRTMLK